MDSKWRRWKLRNPRPALGIPFEVLHNHSPDENCGGSCPRLEVPQDILAILGLYGLSSAKIVPQCEGAGLSVRHNPSNNLRLEFLHDGSNVSIKSLRGGTREIHFVDASIVFLIEVFRNGCEQFRWLREVNLWPDFDGIKLIELTNIAAFDGLLNSSEHPLKDSHRNS
jgi:hypothetical protein